METRNQKAMTLNDFIECDSSKKDILKKRLRDAELEKIESPVYIIWNVAAIIIGF